MLKRKLERFTFEIKLKCWLQWASFSAWFLVMNLSQYLMNRSANYANISIEEENISQLTNFHFSFLFAREIFIARMDFSHLLYVDSLNPSITWCIYLQIPDWLLQKIYWMNTYVVHLKIRIHQYTGRTMTNHDILARAETIQPFNHSTIQP
jgi:hypothetical protein